VLSHPRTICSCDRRLFCITQISLAFDNYKYQSRVQWARKRLVFLTWELHHTIHSYCQYMVDYIRTDLLICWKRWGKRCNNILLCTRDQPIDAELDMCLKNGVWIGIWLVCWDKNLFRYLHMHSRPLQRIQENRWILAESKSRGICSPSCYSALSMVLGRRRAVRCFAKSHCNNRRTCIHQCLEHFLVCAKLCFCWEVGTIVVNSRRIRRRCHNWCAVRNHWLLES